MASDSEPRKFFWRLLEAPYKLHFGKQKACKAQLELQLANSSSGSCRSRTTYRAQYSSSFLTTPVEKVFFRSVLMMKPHRA